MYHALIGTRGPFAASRGSQIQVFFNTSQLFRTMPLVWTLLLLLACVADAAERQTLKTIHVPAAVGHLAPIRNLPGDQRLKLAIGLPLRNQDALDELLRQLYNPNSPNYRQWLTPEQFTERFGPTEEDYRA